MSIRRFTAPLVALLAVGAAAPTPKRAPARIVSLNLCADQYLLALADRSQIAALSRYARDPQMSAAAAQVGTGVGRVPISGGSTEEVLALRPDLILVSPSRKRETKAALESQGLETLEIGPAESYAAILDRIRTVAAAVGHPARGAALIRTMNADLARLPRGGGRGRVAAYYQRRGFLTGTGTLVDDQMRRAGLANLAGKLHRPALSRLSLEQLVAARPDFVIVDTATDRVTDEGTEMMHHPSLDDIARIDLPQAWMVCGGPAYVLAAQSLARQLAARR